MPKLQVIKSKKNILSLKQSIRSGGVGVLKTDTIYGLVGSALNKKAVQRVYKIKKRNYQKPLIVLISSLTDLKKFGISLSPSSSAMIAKFWPGPVSIILPCGSSKFKYLHRGTKSIAFRLPKLIKLRNLLKSTGPLVAPSANIEGFPPAKNIREAESYFGNAVDFYIDSGLARGRASKLFKLEGDSLRILRP